MLTEENYIEASKLLNCEVEVIKAVDEIESQGEGFLDSGKLKILFEGHRFYVYSHNGEQLAKQYPSICYKSWTRKYYKGGELEYVRFNLAFSIHAEAAMLSTSWGRFQIMGDEYWRMDYQSVGMMVDDFKKGEYQQLIGFCKFVLSKKLEKHLQNRNWAAFALGYNGKSYKANKYDTKLKQAYEKHKAIGISANSTSTNS